MPYNFLTANCARLSLFAFLSLGFVTMALGSGFDDANNGLSAFESRGAEAFCRENLRAGMSQFSYQMADKDLLSALSNGFCPETIEAPWRPSIYPDERSRLCNHNRQFYMAENRPVSWHESEKILRTGVSENLERVFKGSIIRTPDWPNDSGGWIELHPQFLKGPGRQELDSEIAEIGGERLILAACASYSLFHTQKCTSAFKEILRVMHPVNEAYLFPVLVEVLSDRDYVSASMMLAMQIQSKIARGGVPAGDLFSDSVEMFRKLGNDEARSTEKAFNLLAIYATHGPNTPGYIRDFITKSTSPLWYSLAAIGTGIPVLNSRSFHSGHPYSYPPGVTSTCDNGKPYHFWLSAFLARYSAKKTGDPFAAQMASYMAEVGYQMRSRTAGHDRTHAFTVSTFDPANNKIRMDLAWAAAGAHFGSESTHRDFTANYRPIDVDQAIRASLKLASGTAPLSSEDALKTWEGTGLRGYFKWDSLFHPKQVFDAVHK